jgi:hypothetical protein
MIEPLLEGAASLLGRAKHCWSLTLCHTGRINARVPPWLRITILSYGV